MLTIDTLSVTTQNKTVVSDVSLAVKPGEVHILSGPNGSGKSSLVMAVAGHPAYTIVQGTITLNSCSVHSLTPNERAKLGLFTVFQHPPLLEGVEVRLLLHHMRTQLKLDVSPSEFNAQIALQAQNLGLSLALLDRCLDRSLSGGERKRLEMLQLSLVKPKYAFIDEVDSGLDREGVKKVAETVEALATKGTGLVIITHNETISRYIPVTYRHRMENGKLVEWQ